MISDSKTRIRRGKIKKIIRLVASFVLVGLTATIIAYVPFYVEEKEKNLASIAVDAATSEFSQWLEDFSQIAERLSKIPVVRSGKIPDIVSFLSEYARTAPKEIEKIIYIDKNGRGYYNTGEVFDLSDRAYFRSIMIDKSADRIVANPFAARSTDNLIAAIVYAVKDDSDNVKGLLFVSINAEKLGEKMQKLRFSNDSYGWAIDSAGRIFAHNDESIMNKMTIRNSPDFGFRGLAEREREIVGANESGRFLYNDSSGKSRVVFYSPIDASPNWVYCVSIDKNFFGYDRAILLVALIAVALFSFLTALIVKSVDFRR
ncbi:MAG: cache domain-containing protein [Helicobacteraceae bacterium]|jgi:hypothetical protein|nr:cache domain-containing protein [Helicobacteraceae bacterium]